MRTGIGMSSYSLLKLRKLETKLNIKKMYSLNKWTEVLVFP